jgi:hypothetical protein
MTLIIVAIAGIGVALAYTIAGQRYVSDTTTTHFEHARLEPFPLFGSISSLHNILKILQ